MDSCAHRRFSHGFCAVPEIYSRDGAPETNIGEVNAKGGYVEPVLPDLDEHGSVALSLEGHTVWYNH